MGSKTFYSMKTTVTPDLCGKAPSMHPSAAFTMFQNAASLHAEEIGNGLAILNTQDRYWVATHTRVDFHAPAKLLDELELTTWPLENRPNAVRSNRCCTLYRGDELIAEGLTEWVILTRDGRLERFCDFGFPEDFEFCREQTCDGRLSRFRDDFCDTDEAFEFHVRSSSIDTGRHMNNVAYVKTFFDCFSADELVRLPIKSVEVRYITACMEGETLKIYKKATDGGFLLGARRADGKCACICRITV